MLHQDEPDLWNPDNPPGDRIQQEKCECGQLRDIDVCKKFMPPPRSVIIAEQQRGNEIIICWDCGHHLNCHANGE